MVMVVVAVCCRQVVEVLCRHRGSVRELGRRGVVPLLCMALHAHMLLEEVGACMHACMQADLTCSSLPIRTLT